MNGGGNPETDPAAERRELFPPWSWAILLSALAWAVIFVAIPPSSQNFPLGDDWAFAHGAIWFAQAQGIHYSHWASMPELGQWIWSWPFLHVIPVEHFALRLSVIVLSWLGLAAFYDLLRRERISERVAAFATGLLALDPLWFVSQGTYMTDVPAISFGLLALCFYARALASKNPRWLWAAMLAAMFAVATRQTMLAVPLAAGVLFWRDREIRWKPFWIISIVAPVIVCGAVAWWFTHRPDVLLMKPVFNWHETLLRPYVALHLCGLVILPLGLLMFRPQHWRIFSVSLIVMLIGAAHYRFSSNGLPYGGLFPYCQGMLSLEGTYTDGLVVGEREMLLTPAVRIVLTALGCIGGAGILAALVAAVRARQVWKVLPLFALIQFFILLTVPTVMDRYLEVFFPGAIFVLAVQAAVFRWRTGLVAMFLYGVISVSLMHDWLAWNSVRWQLGKQAIATGKILPGDIEGGFEWDGWYATMDFNRPPGAASSGVPAGWPSLVLPFTHYIFPQVSGQFALAFTPPDDSTVIAELPYLRWLPPAQEKFYFVGLTR
jgi:4-amino-4-deoxy-L-arabinose transferase-like glycosyltransferase